MNAYDIHLMLNHLPLFGTGLSIIFITIHYISKNQSVFLNTLIISIITGLITIPVYFSGEASEDIINIIPEINPEVLEKHEELGKKAFIFIEVILLISILFMVFIYKNIHFRYMRHIMLILYLSCFILLALVNRSGGDIRHPEIKISSKP